MISIAITTFERPDMTIDSFINVVDDHRVSEIVVVDDCSSEDSFERLKERCRDFPKVTLHRNPFNVGMQANKRKAICLCSNSRVCIWDSDNEMGRDYLDALFDNGHLKNDEIINVPEFAYPKFNFTAYAGKFITAKTVQSYMDDPMFRVMLNTCNYVVPQGKYLEVYEYDRHVKGTDTIHFNFRWLKAGYGFYVVPGMRYFHRDHAGSGFRADMDYNMEDAKLMEEKIRSEQW